MPRKVSLIILLGLVIVLVLGFGMSAVADTAGSTGNLPTGNTGNLPTGNTGNLPTGNTDTTVPTGNTDTTVPTGNTGNLPTGNTGTTAPTGGGSGDAIVGAARAQLGKPHVEGQDGPNAFSCTGLVRYALRASGKDNDAPWDASAYLGRYPAATGGDLPGDIWDYGGAAAIYEGNGMLVMSNLVDGKVEEIPVTEMGDPVAKVRP
ncbi:MAG: hypothetical protein JOZ19_11135 [Rubrobacter sp.]|nr:hypothetical protein [Rubrobacter sp.]